MAITPAQRAAADNQQDAAARDASPQIRLLAGPGTGKSGTIIKRILHLLGSGVNPAEIFVISFTRAACQELRERIEKACLQNSYPTAASQIKVSTMHALALRIAKRGQLLNVGAADPRLLDDWEQAKIFDKELATTLGCTPTRAKEIRLAHDAQWQTLSPTTIAQAAITLQEQQGFTAFHASRINLYCSLLPGEVVFRCVEAINNGQLQPASLPQIAHLIVDEFQDLNACDQEFVRLLCGNGGHLFIAGDDDQSIYSFRHANPNGIVQFQSTYPASSTHILTDCFRCAPAITAPATQLIAVNTPRVAKALTPLYAAAAPPVNGSMYVWSFSNAVDEARAVAESCQQLISSGMAGREDDIVILLSNRKLQLDILTQALGNLGLPFSPPSSGDLTEDEGIRAAYSILRIVADQLLSAPDYPAHRSLLELMSGVGTQSALGIATACIANNQNFRDLFYLPSPPPWLTGRLATAVTRVSTCVAAVATWSLADTLAARSTDLGTILSTQIFQSGGQATANVQAWTNLASVLPPLMTLQELLELFSASTEADQQDVLDRVNLRIASSPAQPPSGPQPSPAQGPVQKKIRILTMHGAKGLSGKVVFIPSAEQGIMPSNRALSATGLLNEQRRLFYVSLSRAMASCIITHASVHTGPTAFLLQRGPVARLTRSQFLNEMHVVSVNRVNGLTPAEATGIVADINNL